jgi:hypothetical protein
LRGGWAPSNSDDDYDKLEKDCTAVAHAMADAVMKDLNMTSKDTPEVEDNSRPSS